MKTRAFTLIELLVVISIIALLIAILLPALGAARKSAQQMQNSTQLRGVHQGFFAFGADNKEWYPGIGSDGQPLQGGGTIAHTTDSGADYRSGWPGTMPWRRFAVMLESETVPPEYLISPPDASIKEVPDVNMSGQNVNAETYSYAIIDIDLQVNTSPITWNANRSRKWVPTPRGQEWKTTANSQAILLSDRAISDNNTPGNVTSPGPVTNYHSIWTDPGSKEWTGSALRNDGSVATGNSPADFQTKYGNGDRYDSDHLFFDDVAPSGGRKRDNARLAHQNATATISRN